jgi:drug/metabolite transporter (DMT)-like permease
MSDTSAQSNLRSGLAIAGATAVISGVSIFINSYGVRDFHSPAVYTTAKNLVAAILLATAALLVPALRGRGPGDRPARTAGAPPGAPWARAAALAYVGAVGGGLAFVLFFTGLARTSAEPAAFVHDTLIVWVGVLAWPALRERLSVWNVGAVGLLVAGEALAAGGVGNLVAGSGELLVLGATLLWAVEIVVAKRLLATLSPGSVALVRMGGGSALLVAYLAATGQLHTLMALDARQLGWALLTGALLACYVGTWLIALARARAVDVTSVLVASVVVTALLQTAAGHGSLVPQLAGLGLVVAGTAAVLWSWPRRASA